MPVVATTEIPDATDLSLDASIQSEMTAIWFAVLNNGEYQIQFRDDDPDGDHPPWGGAGEAAIAHDALLEHTVAGLVDGEQYSVRIRTETDYRIGEWLTAEDITKLIAADKPAVDALSETDIGLSWTNNSDFRGSNQIYRRRADYEYDDNGRLVGTVGADIGSFTDGSAQPGREYEYEVRARSQWVHADSATSTATTSSIGLSDRAVPPRGWHAEVGHPSGSTLTPQILDGAVRRPTINGFPRVEIPAPVDETWHAEAFDDAPLSVWHDGSREPIDTLEHRSLEPGRTVLEGRGGTQLDRRIVEDVDIEPTHEFVERILEEHTDYVINVDDPGASQEERLLQAADSDVELQQALAALDDTVPAEFTADGRAPPLQTAFVAEAEDVRSPATEVSRSDFSGGSGATVSQGVEGLEYTFTTEYTVPAADARVHLRGSRESVDDFYTFDIVIDGETVDSDVTVASSIEWFDSSTPSSDLEPGEHTIEIRGSDDAGSVDIDVLAFVDNRFSYTFPDTLTNGYLDGPQLYPDLVRLELEAITTPLSITDVTLDVTTNDGNPLPELGIGEDGTDTYDTVTDSLSHTLEYSELATTARARIGVGRDPDVTRDDQTPRTGFEPRGIDSLDLSAVLDDTPVLTDRSLKGRLIDVLREVFDYGNFVSEATQNGDQTAIEVTQLEGRAVDVDPDLADYSIDKQTEDVIDRAIVYGGAQRVTRQSVTVTTGEWVDLPFPDSRLVERKETLYDGETEFERGSDYDIRYETEDGQPQLQALADGALSDGQTVSIDADVKPRGEYTAGDVGDHPKTEDVDIPGLASKQMCDQVALYLVEETGDAIVEAEVTVPHDSVEWSVIEAIDPDQLPGDGPYQVREIEANASETTLQLGQGQTVGEAVQEIRDRTSRNSERV